LNERFRDAVERLRAAGVDNPRLDARVLWEHAKKMNRPPQGEGGIFEALIARRVAREPVAYILGRKGFWSLEFAVGPGALVPRPETETLVERVLAAFPDRVAPLSVLDLGTGTGCLLLSVLHEYPNARGIGVDASPEALAWARRNAEGLGLGGRCRMVAGTWGDDLSDGYDVILSNPPYIRASDIAQLAPEVRLYEPPGALDGGPDGLEAYRSLGPEIHRLLNPCGLAFLETGEGQAATVVEILGQSGLGCREIAADLAGIGRCVAAEHRASAQKTVGSPAPNR
jgi:release factor glutamine methyltransferase